MMNENNNIDLKAVGVHDYAVPSKTDKNTGYGVKETSVVPGAEERASQENNKAEISNAIYDLERFYSRTIRFEVDSESDAVTVKVIDKESGEVIRQIPSAELVELSRKIKEYNMHILDVVA